MAKRLNILKTRKLYVNGKFPRSESERYIKYITTDKEQIVNIARASRKDFRHSVKAARLAFKPWKNRTAYNRGQILYRMGEMMESRKDQMADILSLYMRLMVRISYAMLQDQTERMLETA